MKKSILSFALLIIFTASSYGWGATGHRVTGRIADKYLSKKARKAIEKLLRGQSLAMSSTWMDDVRSDSTYDYMEDWHWVTIPSGQTYEQTTKNPNGDIVATLERIISELKSKKLTEAEQAERIKILVHLIGDIHQPLHVGSKDDRGGNRVSVNWFREETNLHNVWDNSMIDGTKLSYTELAESLDKPTPAQMAAWQKASVQDWAKESQSYHSNVYDIGKGRLGYEYAYRNFHHVRARLLQAGVRLAGVLNDIYK
jgi:hypothetical protein